MMNEIRYVVEKGGVSHDERGYIRYDFTNLLGGKVKHRFCWSDLRNATQFISEDRAREMAEESGLTGVKVVYKCYQYDEYCKPYNKKDQMWECMGGV